MKYILKRIKLIHKSYLFFLKLKNIIYTYITIPSYESKRSIILKLALKYRCSAYFIETGTYMGDTLEVLKSNFDKLISIELSSDLASRASKRFFNEPHISIIHGDSSSQLSEIISSIDKGILFWLDGHYSSEFWVNDEYIITAKGEKHTPILEELRQIAGHLHINKHVILVDDARLFNGKDDYPDLSFLKTFVKVNFPAHLFSVKNDMIRILPTYKLQ